jgi:hypothetical protein
MVGAADDRGGKAGPKTESHEENPDDDDQVESQEEDFEN